MGDKTGIQWTDATAIVDRGGRRTRFYCRAEPSRPGQQERRRKAAEGLKWCRGCREWMTAASVRQGACRDCLSAEERARYATSEKFREFRKSQRDMCRRSVARVSADMREDLNELFDGECAYCNNPATTIDHFDPVVRGGKSVQGNVLPCCSSCNSRKRDSDPDGWLDRAPAVKTFTIEYLSAMGAI